VTSGPTGTEDVAAQRDHVEDDANGVQHAQHDDHSDVEHEQFILLLLAGGLKFGANLQKSGRQQ
jgi:hypothetical protein